MNFQDFSRDVEWILRFRDEKSVDSFLSLSEKILGFYEYSIDEIDGKVDDHYIESRRGKVHKESAARSAYEYQMGFLIEPLPSYYRKSSDPKIKKHKATLSDLRKLQKMQATGSLDGLAFNLSAVKKRIASIEDHIEYNNILNTLGKPANISDRQLGLLVNLKYLYAVIFPNNSNRYTPGNLLHQLGVCLLGQSLPRKTDALIDKAIIQLRNHEG